jgi:hypothetical protein
MAISRPFLLALLGAILAGATVLAVQNARSGSESDATPATLQAQVAPAPSETSSAAGADEALKSAFDLEQLKSAKFAAKLGLGKRSESVRFALSGAFERGAANEMPKFEVDARMTLAKQRVAGGFVSLGDKAYFTRGDTGWRLPAAIWNPVVDAVAKGSAGQSAVIPIHPATWVRDVESEGKDEIGGVETDHVSAAVDPKAVVNDLAQATKAEGTELPNAGALSRAVKRADLAVWVGADDHILRRLSGVVVFAGRGRLALDVRLTDVNEPQQIEAPAHVRSGAPGGAFGRFAEGLVGGISGGSVSLRAMTSPNPGRAARAVRRHKKVVILFSNPRGLDDRAMASAMRAVDRRTTALVLSDNVATVERYGKLVEDLGVSQTPSVVIIDRSGKARLIEGYVDADTLTQAVADAR